jgi:hypothetical protein
MSSTSPPILCLLVPNFAAVFSHTFKQFYQAIFVVHEEGDRGKLVQSELHNIETLVPCINGIFLVLLLSIVLGVFIILGDRGVSK